MLKNYFLLAFRNLIKSPVFSLINIAGLAVGLAVCMLITLFVSDELNYDRYNEKADRIYRLNSDSRINGSVFNSADVSPIVGPSLLKDNPQIEAYTRFLGNGDVLIRKGKETITEQHATFADSSLFKVFTMPLVAGNAATALTRPNCMVISETTARKYFNSTDIVGRSLLLDNQTEYQVTGVMKDMPARSHIHFNVIRSMCTLDFSRNVNWLGNSDFVTYVLTRPGTTQAGLSAILDKAVQEYAAPQIHSVFGSSLKDLEKKGDYFRFTVIPLTRIHLYSNLKDELEPNGNIEYVYIFSIVAVLILLVACINFINLSVARSAGRAKEVGIRKVLGSMRSGLVGQFLTESVLTCFIAALLAVMLAALALPWFNQLSGKSISAMSLLTRWTLPVLAVTIVVVGLLAGSYPALLLSSFQPARVLKGRMATGFRTGWLKSGLLVFQFVTAILLVVGTLVIYSQLSYIRNRNIGYNRQQVLVLSNTYALGSQARNFRDEVLNMPGVINGTMTANLPTSGNNNIQGFSKQASFAADQSVSMGKWQVDENYIPTFEMQMAKGRNFSAAFKTDSTAMIINETAAALLGYADPLNKNLYQLDNDRFSTYHIIGVVKDFNFNTLRQKIGPVCFLLKEQRGSMAFRINSQHIPALLGRIEDRYKSYDRTGALPFVYSFMDNDFNRQYRSEQRTGSIFICFAVFAILIACLGLFGLVAYAAEQRTREIGIRKVLGAHAGNIVGILSGDFLRLVGIAALIAFPAGWWLMNNWLRDFAYRTAVQWWVFAVAGGTALLLTLLTAGIQALRAAGANPVKSLRSE